MPYPFLSPMKLMCEVPEILLSSSYLIRKKHDGHKNNDVDYDFKKPKHFKGNQTDYTRSAYNFALKIFLHK